MVHFNKEDYHLHLLLPSKIDKKFKSKTSNNQSLRSGGDNDRKSKRFTPLLCFAPVLRD